MRTRSSTRRRLAALVPALVAATVLVAPAANAGQVTDSGRSGHTWDASSPDGSARSGHTWDRVTPHTAP